MSNSHAKQKKIYNNKSPKFANWTTKKLKEEAIAYHEQIYGEASCYGTNDLRNYDGICLELENRKVKISNKLTFHQHGT